METALLDFVRDAAQPFLDPQKRVFWGYLLAAFLIAFVVGLFAARGGWRRSLAVVFDRSVWWSRSARADYVIFFVNQAVMRGLTPLLISKLAVAGFIFESLHIWFDGRVGLLPGAPGWAIAALFTFSLFVLDDGAKYLVHRALHRWPALWRFHQVHHTAETLTPMTVYRTHPVEGVAFALRAIFVQGVMIAAFIYFFGERATLATVLGANVFLFIFNVAGSNLRHSHIWLSYGDRVERLLISPAQHQIHHSIDPAHHDRNFGAVLAVWDWMGGSLHLAGRRQRLRFGVTAPGADAVSPHGLWAVYVTPCIDAARDLAAPVSRGIAWMLNFARTAGKRRQIAGGLLLLAALAIALFPFAGARAEGVLNIYSHRQPFLIKPFIDAYRAKTDIEINIVFASKGLAQRLQAEGARSPADVVLTVDIARLNVYADKDLLAKVESPTLDRTIPAHLRDPEGRWFAFSKRARVIAVAKAAEDALAIERYEDLADPKWRDRICSRPGSHVYNRALVASIIHSSGVEAAQQWAQGVVDNLARRPQGNDRAQVKAIYEGVCDIAVINNYYFGKLKHSEKAEHRDWADAVTLIFPNQADRGSHVNISGGGVAKHSKNKAEAVRFLEFLTSQEAQDLYGAINFEYPVNPEVAVPAELKSWGEFREDQMPIARIAELAPEAQKVIDRVRW